MHREPRSVSTEAAYAIADPILTLPSAAQNRKPRAFTYVSPLNSVLLQPCNLQLLQYTSIVATCVSSWP